MTEAERVIEILQLKSLDLEGGYYLQTYKSEVSTAIYYFLTSVPQSWASTLLSLYGDGGMNYFINTPISKTELLT
jgi:hypothetical protein